MIFLATSSIRCPLLGRKCIQSTVTSRPFASESNDRPNSSARLVTLLSSFVKKNSPHSNHRKSTTEPHSSICFCRTNEPPTNDIPCYVPSSIRCPWITALISVNSPVFGQSAHACGTVLHWLWIIGAPFSEITESMGAAVVVVVPLP